MAKLGRFSHDLIFKEKKKVKYELSICSKEKCVQFFDEHVKIMSAYATKLKLKLDHENFSNIFNLYCFSSNNPVKTSLVKKVPIEN